MRQKEKHTLWKVSKVEAQSVKHNSVNAHNETQQQAAIHLVGFYIVFTPVFVDQPFSTFFATFSTVFYAIKMLVFVQ